MVEQQLIETFVDGISNDQLKLKILRDRPNTLRGAISIATNEQNLRARVALSHSVRNEQPMEVGHSRNRIIGKLMQLNDGNVAMKVTY